MRTALKLSNELLEGYPGASPEELDKIESIVRNAYNDLRFSAPDEYVSQDDAISVINDALGSYGIDYVEYDALSDTAASGSYDYERDVCQVYLKPKQPAYGVTHEDVEQSLQAVSHELVHRAQATSQGTRKRIAASAYHRDVTRGVKQLPGEVTGSVSRYYNNAQELSAYAHTIARALVTQVGKQFTLDLIRQVSLDALLADTGFEIKRLTPCNKRRLAKLIAGYVSKYPDSASRNESIALKLVSTLLEDGADDFDFDAPSPDVLPSWVKTAKDALKYTDAKRGRAPGFSKPFRCAEAEPLLKQSAKYATEYACYYVKRRWPEAEPTIAKDWLYWNEYCKHFNILGHGQSLFYKLKSAWKHHFGMFESESADDFDFSAPSAPPTWQDACVAHGLKMVWPGHYTLLRGAQSCGNVQAVYDVFTDTVHVSGWASNGVRAFSEHYKDTWKEGIDAAIGRAISATEAWRKPVRESTDDIPDLDVDVIALSSETWQDACYALGLYERGDGSYTTTTFYGFPHVQVVPNARDENALTVYGMTGDRHVAYSSCAPKANCAQLRAEIKVAKNKVGLRPMNESDIPDLDVDALHVPPAWQDVCVRAGLKKVAFEYYLLGSTAVGSYVSVSLNIQGFLMLRGENTYRHIKATRYLTQHDTVALANALEQVKQQVGFDGVDESVDEFDFDVNSTPVLPKGVDTPMQAYEYAMNKDCGRWPEVESLLLTSPMWAFTYARDVIKGRWPEAESVIMQAPDWAYWYAYDVIKGRWPEAEPVIRGSAYWWRVYCKDFGITESEIPDLDMDALEVPSMDWNDVVQRLDQRGFKMHTWECYTYDESPDEDTPYVAVHSVDNGEAVTVYGSDAGIVVYKAKLLRNNFCDIDSAIDAALAATGLDGVNESVEGDIPDLDADPLACPVDKRVAWEQALWNAGFVPNDDGTGYAYYADSSHPNVTVNMQDGCVLVIHARDQHNDEVYTARCVLSLDKECAIKLKRMLIAALHEIGLA